MIYTKMMYTVFKTHMSYIAVYLYGLVYILLSICINT